MYCRNCGEDIEVGSAYCSHCGAPVENEPVRNFRSHTRSWLNLFWGVLVILMAVVLVGTFIDYYRKSAAEPEPTYQEQVADLSQSVLLVNVYDRDKNLLKTGSGFVMFNDETLVTNFHVIKDAHSVEAVDNTDASYSIDGAYAYDVAKDVAILHFSAPSGLPVLEMGDSDAVQVGDEVTAIGSPLGLKNTVSKGIISAVREEQDWYILQTTAPISPGSSGGALFNQKGEVIGTTYAGMASGENLNLAVPSKYINRVRNINPFGETKMDSRTGEITPAYYSFSEINKNLPIINEQNQEELEGLMAQYGKSYVSSETIGFRKESLETFGANANSYVDMISIEDTESRKLYDKYLSDFDNNFRNGIPAPQVDFLLVLKCSQYERPEHLTQILYNAYQGNLAERRDIYRETNHFGDYVYYLNCGYEDTEFYYSLLEILCE